MKVDIITRPNQKGQIVIPKEFRKALGITQQMPLQVVLSGDGLYIYPITEIVRAGETDDAYLEVLEITKGAWGDNGDVSNKSRSRAKELKASSRRKRAW